DGPAEAGQNRGQERSRRCLMNLRSFNRAVGRYIPKNSAIVQHPDGLGLAYVYNESFNGKSVIGAVAYHGKANKSDWHHTFRTEEQRQKHIAEWFDSLTKSAASKQEWRDQRKAARQQPIPPSSGLKANW